MRLIGPLLGLVSRLMSPFVDLVSRVSARVQFKLLAAFLAIAMLLIMVGAVGLEVLSGVNQRVEELLKLQRKIEAYIQVQHDTTTQLYGVRLCAGLCRRADAVEHAAPAQPVRLRRGSPAVRREGRSRTAWPVPAGLRPAHRGRDARRGFDSR